MAKIQGKIIRIIDTRTAIINLGGLHGITSNSVFHILGDPEPVVDPETGQELGRVAVVKTKLKANHVDELFTIATTRWTNVHRKGGSFSLMIPTQSMMRDLFGEVETEVIDEGEMRIAPTDVKPWKAQTEALVRVGDMVEVIVPDPVPLPGTEHQEAADEAGTEVTESDEAA